MKKKILSVALMCLTTTGINAQVYAYDSWAQLPTMDLYDSGVTDMYLRALAETAARRKADFELYTNQAAEAFRQHRWQEVINRVNWALSTEYYNGDIFYMRGYAYEMLGNWSAAKKDYRKGKKHGSYKASMALDSLKAKIKQGRKK